LVSSSQYYVPDVKLLDENTPIAPSNVNAPSIFVDNQGRAFAWWFRGLGSDTSLVYALRTSKQNWFATNSLPVTLGSTQSLSSTGSGTLLYLYQAGTGPGNNPVMYATGSTSTGLNNFQVAATFPGIVSIKAGIDQAGNGFAIYGSNSIYAQHYNTASGTWDQPTPIAGVNGFTIAFATCPNGDGHLLWAESQAIVPTNRVYISTYHAQTASWDVPLQIDSVAATYVTGNIACNASNSAFAAWDILLSFGPPMSRAVRGMIYTPAGGWGQTKDFLVAEGMPTVNAPKVVLADTGLAGVSWADSLSLVMGVAIYDPQSGWLPTPQFSTSSASDQRLALISPYPNQITAIYSGSDVTKDFYIRNYASGSGWGLEYGLNGFSYYGDPNSSYKFSVGPGGSGVVVWEEQIAFPDTANGASFGTYILAQKIQF